jgi:hypothetical protein
MRIKIEIQNKFYIGLKCGIKKKNQFDRWTKKQIKRMRNKIDIKNKNKILIEG